MTTQNLGMFYYLSRPLFRETEEERKERWFRRIAKASLLEKQRTGKPSTVKLAQVARDMNIEEHRGVQLRKSEYSFITNGNISGRKEVARHC